MIKQRTVPNTDWLGTTVTGILVRAGTVGGLTVSGVTQGAAISVAGRALYYGAKGLFPGGHGGGSLCNQCRGNVRLSTVLPSNLDARLR